MNDALAYLQSVYSVKPQNITRIISGNIYSAALIEKQAIGVCANLQQEITIENLPVTDFNLAIPAHRIWFNAALNASINHKITTTQGDIFDRIIFRKYNRILMVGEFKPLIAKFETARIPIKFYDYLHMTKQEMQPMPSDLEKADCIILTATSLQNNTLVEICETSKSGADVFVLGPSCPLSNEMFAFRNVKILFGSVFTENLDEIEEIIAKNGGTPMFGKLGRKVFVEK